ncbi:MAG: 4Fe-4S dicluster domain-containing protein [Candidatus Rokubacteria bacterium]|nr:4Fe-4S dicluster domain-containing protein [Candidatus Rokubacteria bacterium]
MTLLLADIARAGGLLDAVEEASGQNVFACYQCGKCTAGCPFSLGPQQVVRLLQLGEVEAALAHMTTWDCASCLTCATACPKGVSPTLIHRALRTLHASPAAQNGHGGERTNGAALDAPYRAHARPLRTYLFTNIHRLSRLGSAMAPLSNWALRVPGANLVAHGLLGIHRARSLPAFVRRTFPEWFRDHTPLGDGRRGPVALFHDTFMDFNFPGTGIAVTELFEKAGFRVELADMVCCGRPMISKGLVARASVQAETNVTRLWARAREGVPIVGCEPSCLLTLRDEYPAMVPANLRDKARVVAGQTFLIDEFLAPLAAKGDLDLTFRDSASGGPSVLFHGHCHQKASAAPAKSVELLRLAGYRAHMVDASCCGMAGAYGYEKEHYEASRAAGERALFPILRAHPDAEIAVMGTSCRQQVEHFTGRRTRHVVELLRAAVD